MRRNTFVGFMWFGTRSDHRPPPAPAGEFDARAGPAAEPVDRPGETTSLPIGGDILAGRHVMDPQDR